MPVLFAISILVLVALLWASIAITHRARRERRRRKREHPDESMAGPGTNGLAGATRTRSAAELNFLEVTPYSQAAVARSAPVQLPPVPATEVRGHFDELEPAATPVRETEPELVEQRTEPAIPAAVSATTETAPAASYDWATPGFPKPSVASGMKPPPASMKKMHRVDWTYFNKDLGDLTDPYETPRAKPKSRARH